MNYLQQLSKRLFSAIRSEPMFVQLLFMRTLKHAGNALLMLKAILILLLMLTVIILDDQPVKAQPSISQVNQWREEVGLPPLTGNPTMDRAILQHECSNGILGSCELMGQVGPALPSPTMPGRSRPEGYPMPLSDELSDANAIAEEGCKYDTQCKGERICVKGECVSPPLKSEGLESPSSSSPPSPDQSPTRPIESQSETKTEKSAFIGDWNVSITDAELTKGDFTAAVYTEYTGSRFVPIRDTQDWRITSSNDSLIIETIRTANLGWNSTIRDVEHKNHFLTFTEEIKGERGKEIIQYYLKSVNEDKIEGQWKSQGYYNEDEWEVDGKLVMRRMFLPPSTKPLPQIPENPGNGGTFLDKPEPPAMPPLRGSRSTSSSSSPRSNCSYCYTAWHSCNSVCRMAWEPRPDCHDNCNVDLASCEDRCRSSNR